MSPVSAQKPHLSVMVEMQSFMFCIQSQVKISAKDCTINPSGKMLEKYHRKFHNTFFLHLYKLIIQSS